MLLDQKTIVGLVSQLIDVRNQVRSAIAAREQIIEVPAVPATAANGATPANPGKPAWQKATGQLPNANNNLFVAAGNLLDHLKNIGGADEDIAKLRAALNAPLKSPQSTVPSPQSGTTATATAPASAAVK